MKTANPEYIAERGLPFGNPDLARKAFVWRKLTLLNLLSFRYETKAKGEKNVPQRQIFSICLFHIKQNVSL